MTRLMMHRWKHWRSGSLYDTRSSSFSTCHTQCTSSFPPSVHLTVLHPGSLYDARSSSFSTCPPHTQYTSPFHPSVHLTVRLAITHPCTPFTPSTRHHHLHDCTLPSYHLLHECTPPRVHPTSTRHHLHKCTPRYETRPPAAPRATHTAPALDLISQRSTHSHVIRHSHVTGLRNRSTQRPVIRTSPVFVTTSPVYATGQRHRSS